MCKDKHECCGLFKYPKFSEQEYNRYNTNNYKSRINYNKFDYYSLPISTARISSDCECNNDYDSKLAFNTRYAPRNYSKYGDDCKCKFDNYLSYEKTRPYDNYYDGYKAVDLFFARARIDRYETRSSSYDKYDCKCKEKRNCRCEYPKKLSLYDRCCKYDYYSSRY